MLSIIIFVSDGRLNLPCAPCCEDEDDDEDEDDVVVVEEGACRVTVDDERITSSLVLKKDK